MDIDQEISNLSSEIVAKYTYEEIMTVAVEEAAEFIAAVSQFKRGRITIDDLASEIADMRIVSENALKLIDTMGPDGISSRHVAAKVKRARERLL